VWRILKNKISWLKCFRKTQLLDFLLPVHRRLRIDTLTQQHLNTKIKQQHLTSADCHLSVIIASRHCFWSGGGV
jgi:hypothetical protein